MIAALADAGAVLGRADYLDAARGAADVPARAACATPDGRLLRTYNAGEREARRLPRGPRVPARGAARPLRGDVRGALVRRGARARRRDRRALRRRRARRLLLDRRRPRAARRAAQGPRGHADPVGRLGRRARPAAPRRAHRRARLRGAGGRAAARCCTSSPPRHPQAFGHLLQALDFYLAPRREVALAGDPAGVAALAARRARGAAARTSCSPAGRATAPTAVPLLEGRTPVDGRAAAYVCERFACRTPVTEPDELRALLES